ncbi:hypothetical protein C5167_030735 [Papaver somniferum]|nr:hypothetical protein C5167_030735 [Papaver somniferum]
MHEMRHLFHHLNQYTIHYSPPSACSHTSPSSEPSIPDSSGPPLLQLWGASRRKLMVHCVRRWYELVYGLSTTGSEVPCLIVLAKDDLDPFVLDLSQDPVSVIQPVSRYGLSILYISSQFYLREVMNAIDWVGIVLAGVGIRGVGVGGDGQKASSINALTDDYHDLLDKVQGSSFYCI